MARRRERKIKLQEEKGREEPNERKKLDLWVWEVKLSLSTKSSTGCERQHSLNANTTRIYLKTWSFSFQHPSIRPSITVRMHKLWQRTRSHPRECWLKISCARLSYGSLECAWTNAQCIQQLLLRKQICAQRRRMDVWERIVFFFFFCEHLFAC